MIVNYHTQFGKKYIKNINHLIAQVNIKPRINETKLTKIRLVFESNVFCGWGA